MNGYAISLRTRRVAPDGRVAKDVAWRFQVPMPRPGSPEFWRHAAWAAAVAALLSGPLFLWLVSSQRADVSEPPTRYRSVADMPADPSPIDSGTSK